MKKSPSSRIFGETQLASDIRAFDWARTSLGPIESWSPTLVATINLLLQSDVPIVTLWGDDGIMIYNDAYSLFSGQRHERLLGSKVVEGWPEVADFNRNIMDKVYRQSETLSYEATKLTLHRNDVPEDVWLDLNYSPVITETGETEGVFAVVTEITQFILAERGRKKAETALLAERERLQSIFLQAPALIAVLRGPQHIFEMANPLYIATVSPHRDIIGKPVIEAIPELAGQGIVDILDTVLATNQPYRGELSVKLDRSNTGKLEDAYFNLVYQPISSVENGPADGIFIHAVDVTEHVNSRQRVEQLNAELEAVFESLPDGVFTFDKEKMTNVNLKGAQILGYSSPDEVPRKLTDFYKNLSLQYGSDAFEKTRDIDQTSIGRALRGEIVNNINVHLTNIKTGVKRVVRSAAAPILDSKGKVVGAVATTSDITEQYELQSKIQKESIRRRVLLQKARLLKEQNEKLTTLNETKDEFIALTSHQLRTPATGVKQYTGMILQGFAGDVSKQQKEFLERAYESNDRQLMIIDDILRVARIDLDQIKISRSKQDVCALVRRLVEEQQGRFNTRSQSVILNLPHEAVEARVDTQNFAMAVGNIIDNACKYTADGKNITITLSSEKKYFSLSIADEGVGIAEKDLPKLFQKFSRIHNDRSIAVGGTGLGLYLAHKLIEKQKGTITVESQLNKGTTFTIRLPL